MTSTRLADREGNFPAMLLPFRDSPSYFIMLTRVIGGLSVT